MTKQELIHQAAAVAGLDKKKTKQVLEALLCMMTQALSDGETVKLTGFGNFKVTKVKEREGRNPATGEKMTIPAHEKAKFTPYKKLKESVISYK